jgi:hypothetical protein
MAIISRGFSGRRSASEAKLPPGQYLTTDFPVLSAGPTPRMSLDRWEFTIDDGSNVLKRWDWKSFRELPTETITVDLQLRNTVVETEYVLGRGFTRCPGCGPEDRFAICNVSFVRRLHDEPALERCHEQAGLDRVQIQRCRS